MLGGILLVSQLVLVLMLMLDAYATGFLRRQKLQLYIVHFDTTLQFHSAQSTELVWILDFKQILLLLLLL